MRVWCGVRVGRRIATPDAHATLDAHSRGVDVGLLVACGLRLLALAPLRRGYVLTFDMVFVHEPPFTPRA